MIPGPTNMESLCRSKGAHLKFCIRSLTSELVLRMVEPNKKLASNQQQRHLIKFWDNESKTDSQCFNN